MLVANIKIWKSHLNIREGSDYRGKCLTTELPRFLLFWKSGILTPTPGSEVRGSAGKFFVTMLLHTWFPLIWYATWHCSEKVEFWPFDSSGQGVGEILGTMLLHFMIPINLICSMTMFWKSWILTYWPHPYGPGGGGLKAKKLLPCCCILQD